MAIRITKFRFTIVFRNVNFRKSDDCLYAWLGKPLYKHLPFYLKFINLPNTFQGHAVA
jgi:hypothetical protein